MSQKTEIKSTAEPLFLDTYSSAYAPAGAGLKWAKFYISYTDLAAANTASTYIIAVPDSVTFIHCIINVTQGFDVAGYTVSVGDDITANDGIAASSDCTSTIVASTASKIYHNGQDIKIYASAGANLDTATTGALEINILYAPLP